MRILGIDPGSLRTGWGVIERRGNRLVAIAADVIKTDRDDGLHLRLRDLHAELERVIAEYRPETVAIEDIFQSKFAQSALKLGQARGVALLAAAQANLDVHAYPPAVVKRTVGGRGAADKAQVAQLVGAILGLTRLPALDATDALAVAITHAQASPLHLATKAQPKTRGSGSRMSRSRSRSAPSE